MTASWSDLEACLEDSGHEVKLWLRDDDAVSDTAAIRRLGDWASRAEVSVLLACVPAEADETLCAALIEMPQLVPCVHGWAHKNHAPADEKKQELGTHRPKQAVLQELQSGLERMRGIAGGKLVPVLVPPWNRISDDVATALPSIGFEGLSCSADRFADEAPRGLVVANSHLDLMDWKGGRIGRQHDLLIAELIQLIGSRTPHGLPIGVLAHHLAHDETGWSFLEGLADVIRSETKATWLDPRNLFARPNGIWNY